MNDLAGIYVDMKQEIINAGYANEIDWQDNIDINKVTEQEFIREAAWVILSAGISERVISKIFERISEAFLNWESTDIICKNEIECKKNALKIFKNNRKISAILQLIQIIKCNSYKVFHSNIISEGIAYIQTLPFMGPATSYHLAKNIGINIAKPDRHLSRIAQKTQIGCPNHLCETISRHVGDNVAVVDLVLWRYAAITPNYLDYFPVG